jgi:hypothetical protein
MKTTFSKQKERAPLPHKRKERRCHTKGKSTAATQKERAPLPHKRKELRCHTKGKSAAATQTCSYQRVLNLDRARS